MRQVFLDTETTGLSPESGDRIVEIGCVEMIDRRLTGEQRHFYLNPQRANSEDAYRVHGLSDEFLAGQPLFAAVADDLLAFVGGAELIIHNAAFDVGFLNAELRRVGKPLVADVAANITDSLVMAREQYPGKANSLDALCKRLEVDNTHRTLHGALLDAELLAEVYIRMTRGQHALVIDAADDEVDSSLLDDSSVVMDFSALRLMVIGLTPEEQAAHEAVLAEVSRESAGNLLWPKAMA